MAIHVLVDENFRLVKFLLSAGNFNDNPFALMLLSAFPIKSMPRLNMI